VARLDALVITGGADVDPGRYAAEPHPQTVSWRTDRDAWELALLDAADGTLEAMEAAGDRFEVAVQWHPEARADAGLFRGLVAAAVDAD
jgi:gamma-glutamyl-gamma-aminobutyrate hydrolase PuuD